MATKTSFSRNKRFSYNPSTVKDVEFQDFLRQCQAEYPSWWTCERFFRCIRSLPEDTVWNCFICVVALLAIVWVFVDEVQPVSKVDIDVFIRDLKPYITFVDVIYNVVYAVHVISIAYHVFFVQENEEINYWIIGGFVLDFATFLHFAIELGSQKLFKLVCYYLRLHRPFKYLWQLNDYNLKGSILGTTLKYCYIFFVLRVTWALVWIHIDEFERDYTQVKRNRALYEVQLAQPLGDVAGNTSFTTSQFLVAVYMVNKMFIPIGPSVAPSNDIERIACLLIMITGCLVVTGAAVASLSLVFSIYMRPEEDFRGRYRLIMKEMKESNVLPSLREKVETFYKMYWHKQKAVSATQLLPTFPSTLPASIHSEIYFEATQKSRILRDLSYEFLSEVAKKMYTIHYIPGDTIIKRSSRKSSIIYIAYGDIEMLSAEDDSTAVVRMTRGTAVAGCAGDVAAACARAHVDIRAATFCTAHELHAPELWRVALKYGRETHQTNIILSSFHEHLEKVKKHYKQKIPEEVKYKSSILHFKRNLMALKEAKDSEGKLLLERTDVFLEIAGSYIMRNRADGSQTDEADPICLRSTFPCILQPWSSLQIAWQSFMCCVILTVCFTHPYVLVFKQTVPIEFRFFDYVVTALYVVDLIVHLSTGANVEEGVPITFSQTSAQQMRSQWFVLDVAGTLPIFEFIDKGHFAGINKLLRLPKVFRVLKSMEEMCVYNSNQFRFMSYTLLLLVACYLIASLQQGFMCFKFRYCLVRNFTHPPYWENGTLDEETVMHRLTFGLYWAISMITFTTHMEPFGVEDWHSVLYTMIVLEVCIVLHIFIEAVYSATIMVTTALREDYDSCIANVKDFLIRNDVDEQLRKRFITYLQLCWYTDKAYSMTNKKTSIFFDLPPHVYQDIVTRQRSKYLLSLPFMKLLNKEDLKDVSSNAKLFYTTPNEILLNTGDISNEIYLIKQGICEIIHPDTKEVVGSLGVKSHFGVLECLLRIPAFYTVRAVTHVQVFTISKKVLSQVMSLPQVKDAVEFAKEQPEYSRLVVHRDSFLRYEAPPIAPNMERFRLPRKYEEDYDFLHPFNRLGFFSILRYIFPRYSIRPDGDYLVHYEWCRATCALLSASVFPSYTYLVLQWPSLYWLTLLLDFSAYFDIAQRMLVGYFNEQGLLVYHPTSTAAHYLKGAFFADLMGCLPMENLESPLRESFQNNYRLTQSRQLLMLNRLLQLYRLPSAMTHLGNKIERGDLLLVLQAIPLFLALLNALTCLMVFNSVNIFRSADSSSWLIVPLPDQGGSWVELFSNTFRFNLTETPWNLYLATHFWVVYETTTTGYNSFNPSNFQLMVILFIGMVIGAMITTYFSVRIISIRANVNKELAAYQEHIKDILVFMRRENLDKKLQKEVMSYYEYNWDKMGGIDYTNVLKLCDQITLRTDAILHIYGPTFARCPLLANCDVSLLRNLGRAVRSLYFLRGMHILEVDDVIGNIYFVDYGSLAVKTPSEIANSISSESMITLTRGSVFGNLENAGTARCPVAIVATSRTHVLQVHAAAFRSIIADFPQVAAAMDAYRQENEYYIMGHADDMKRHNPSLAAMLFTSQSGIGHVYFKDELIQLYLIIVSLGCIYADLYNAGFQDNSTVLIIVLYAFDVGFYLKILMHYSLPYIVPDHLKLILLPLRRVYLKTEFKYDVISCLPLELISLACGRYQWMVFSHLRLNRLFRIVTVYKCLMKHHSRITVNLTLSTVFTVLIWFTLFVHTAACLWYFISVLEDSVNPYSSWIYTDSKTSLCHNLYVCSVYFVLTTFTQNGVGDIMPKNHAEVIFVSILQIISTLLYMIYVGEFSNIIQFQSFRSFSFYCKYLELQEFLKNNRVSRNLVTVVNKYTLHLWRETRGMQVPHFLKTAPHCLKLQVMSAAYMHHLRENPVFEECEPAFLRQLVGCLQLYTYNEGMFVVKESEITDAMYLIHTGRVLETSVDTGDLKTYTSTECFGVEQGLAYDTPFAYSYKTVIKSQVLTLQLHDWEYLLDHFPKSKKIVFRYLKRDDDHHRYARGKGKRKRTVKDPFSDFPPGPNSPPGPLPLTAHRSPTNIQGSTSPKPPPSPTVSPSLSPPGSPVDYSFEPMVDRATGHTDVLLSDMAPSTSSAIPDVPSKPAAPEGIGATAATVQDISIVPQPASDTLAVTTPQSHHSDLFLSNISLDQKTTVYKDPSDIAMPTLKLASESKTTEPISLPQTDKTTPSTEPIVAHPYSNISLKITELPSSSTKINGTAKTFMQESLPSTSRNIPVNETINKSSENQPKEVQFMWPTDNRNSGEDGDDSVKKNSEKGEKSELDPEKSQKSIQSQQSFIEKEHRGPRDIEEALHGSSTLIDKVETKAKKMFGQKTTSEDEFVAIDGLSEKDLLLIEEDEDATSALLHEIKKYGHVSPIDIDTANKDAEITEIVAVDETQSADIRSEIFEMRPPTVRIQDPREDSELAIILYDRKTASSISKARDINQEDRTSSAIRKKSVRYKEESQVFPDSKSNSESEHGSDFKQTKIKATDATPKDDAEEGTSSDKKDDEFMDQKPMDESKKDNKKKN